MALNAEAVAIYWDFENLHASLVDQLHGPGAYAANCFRPQNELIDVATIIEFALSVGPIAINRAFANWVSFNRYKQALLQSAVELIQVFPPGANAKNGADIKLCLDVMEDMVRFPHIGTIVVVGGDSDYMPLSYKVKAAGRTLVGIGSRISTNQHWARSCHEFKFYEAMLSASESLEGANTVLPPAPAPAPTTDQAAIPTLAMNASEPIVNGETNELRQLLDLAVALPDSKPDARQLVVKAMSRLAQSRGETWIQKARLRPFIQRMDSTFQESNYGFTSFSDLLSSMKDLIEVRQGEFDHELRLRGLVDRPAPFAGTSGALSRT